MKLTKYFLNQTIILLAIFIFLFHVLSHAQVKEIISEGTYNMGDGETPGVAESRALLNAKRVALEQAGTYVESYSKVKNSSIDRMKLAQQILLNPMGGYDNARNHQRNVQNPSQVRSTNLWRCGQLLSNSRLSKTV